MSISFQAHMLGDKIEFDQAGGTLTLRNLSTQLTDQLKRAATLVALSVPRNSD